MDFNSYDRRVERDLTIRRLADAIKSAEQIKTAANTEWVVRHADQLIVAANALINAVNGG